MAALSRPRQFSKHTAHYKRSLWFERIMALIALANLVMVIFDVSYIPFRDLYLRFLPDFTTWYGETFKGIEPNTFTTNYLASVDQLEVQVAQTGLNSADAQALLEELRQQSADMIDEDPFQVANKSGTLELIKLKMRNRVGTESSTEAFDIFWSRSYLSQEGYAHELRFFSDEIRPYIETNYYRGIGIDGGPTNWFWRIDAWFILIFFIELTTRCFFLSRRYKNLTMRDAIVWRWYDLLLIIPFTITRLPWLALLRIIPVTIRLNQSRLIDLRPWQNRISHFLISQVAIELTEVILLRVIDQLQNLIRNGEASDWLLRTGSGRQYIDLNDINELEAISQRTLTVIINQVLPQIKPELDTVVNQSVQKAMGLAPGYQSFQHIPGIGRVPDQMTQYLVAEVSQNLYQALQKSLASSHENPAMQALFTKFAATLRSEIQQDNTLEELEAMTLALLEEVKINYVKRLSQEDYDMLQERRFHLYDVTQKRAK
ncbi:MAG: hypothetical protein AAFW95_06000 [Cyanobacteria bacterium J06638_6]